MVATMITSIGLVRKTCVSWNNIILSREAKFCVSQHYLVIISCSRNVAKFCYFNTETRNYQYTIHIDATCWDNEKTPTERHSHGEGPKVILSLADLAKPSLAPDDTKYPPQLGKPWIDPTYYTIYQLPWVWLLMVIRQYLRIDDE